MQTISKKVIEIIRQKPFISEAMQSGIINLSSLSRMIKPEIENSLNKKIQEGAIIMALQRYTQQTEVTVSHKLRSCLNSISDIIVRSDLSEYTFKNSYSLFAKHVSFVKKITLDNDVFFTFTHGVFESNYVVSNSLNKFISKVFENEIRVTYETNLSSIVIRLPKINTQTLGLYYYILQEIAMNGINIINIISTSNEITLIVKDDDVDRCFSLIKKLKSVMK